MVVRFEMIFNAKRLEEFFDKSDFGDVAINHATQASIRHDNLSESVVFNPVLRISDVFLYLSLGERSFRSLRYYRNRCDIRFFGFRAHVLPSSIREAGVTSSPLAILWMFRSVTFVSPRSIRPMNVRWRSARSASSSCEIPFSRRKVLTRSPNCRFIRFFIEHELKNVLHIRLQRKRSGEE